MLSKSQIRFITSLKQKKFRKLHGVFVVEGTKSVEEFIDSDYEVLSLFITPDATTKMSKIPRKIEFFEITDDELKKISNLTTPQGVLAVVKIPMEDEKDLSFVRETTSDMGFTLVLDDVQDPGNLGTIIRTADWFGFSTLICSVGSVDAYNPKAVQASMGSLARVRVLYTDLTDLFASSPLPVFGAVLDGQSIYEIDFGKQGFVLLGNEGQGISPEIQSFIHHPVTIPRRGAAESLNVAISAALFCSELYRRSPS
ncbi:MAG TPA: RNA methyltransferase [Sphingobacteriaceae bacterium]|nr:RNA methyltransferase [Sphingobacteriaceae bacterium]